MIFVLTTDDKTLEIFPDEQTAISSCEGVDVEDENCLFWDDSGNPLCAEFSEPNQRGRFSVVSGKYKLVSCNESDNTNLLDILDNVQGVEGKPPLNTIEAVRNYLLQKTNST